MKKIIYIFIFLLPIFLFSCNNSKEITTMKFNQWHTDYKNCNPHDIDTIKFDNENEVSILELGDMFIYINNGCAAWTTWTTWI